MVFIQEIILPRIKDGTFVMNLYQLKSTGTHWIALYVIAENLTYFDSFGVEHIPKEVGKFIGNKNITTNIYIIQAYDSIICGNFYIGCIDFI